MKRGLVIGKFMPLHHGHIALINYAAERCDELIVSMSYTHYDAINPQLRFSWLQHIFSSNLFIKCYLIKDDFDNENLPLYERTKLWAKRIQQVYPPISYVFSSESYGEPFAESLAATHIPFDVTRALVPVSATLIRTKPFTYWNFIPDIVRPYFVKKICFFGPESTGKTYMASRMSAIFNTQWVSEAARAMLTSNEFTKTDIIKIATKQFQDYQTKLLTANKFLFCDTDVITTQIYSQHYLGEVPAELLNIELQTPYDIYFLMNIDVPWIADYIRDFGDRRNIMMEIFTAQLDKRKILCKVVSGSYAEREQQVIHTLNEMLMQY
ncbi:AAA family ATPase [Panacibacter sp. DH6]|uniref:AAA family ATPase n=1 Tax=Panacibacter microcysteis TaxID=2793269 RepID=A0A931EA02_9BACT|nr:AAA family ATPase [Panacibacter microcysteis]MBG9376899.1 AAA family ATPase [Panacibacter microcysteis]